MYEVHFPITPLRPFIECFWFLKADLVPPARLEENIFTDARADIVFTFGSPYFRCHAGQDDQTQIMQVSNLDAQRRYPVYIIQQGQIHLIGVRFRPGGLAAFLPMPPGEVGGLTIAWPEVFGQSGDDLEYQLFETAGQRHRQLDLLNAFFLRRLAIPAAHTQVSHMATTMERCQGKITMEELSRKYGYSSRTLNRLFQQVMGLSPKFYARTVRFRQTLNYLLHDPTVAWTDIVSTYGYHDQPHFIKEFVEFTGITPEVYRAQLHRTGFASTPNLVQFLQDKPKTSVLQ